MRGNETDMEDGMRTGPSRNLCPECGAEAGFTGCEYEDCPDNDESEE